jgi:hypothetical protein
VGPSTNPPSALLAVWNEITANNACDSKLLLSQGKQSSFVRSDGGALFHPYPQ